MPSTMEALREAMRLLQSGRPDEAERILALELGTAPQNPDALALLGLVHAQRGDNDRAAELLAQSIALSPHQLAAYVNLAKVLTKLERWTGVISTAGEALARRPDHMEARRLRGQALAELKRDAEALADLDAVTTENPATLLTRAKLRYRAGRAAEAVSDYDRIVTLAPGHWEAWNNRGIALEDFGRHAEALASYERALQLNPQNLSLRHNRAAVLTALKRPEEALPLFEHLVAEEPTNVDNWVGYGAALANLSRLAEAIRSFDKALELDPESARAFVSRGAALAGLGRTREAIADYRRAIAAEPTNAAAHANLAFSLLADGNLSEGFAEYEWRRNDGPILRTKRAFAAPEWQGEPLAGKTLLLHPEQGLGDVIQFARFVPDLAAQGAHIVLEAPAALEPILKALEGDPQIVPTGGTLPPFDLHAPLMSLGAKLGLTLERIPAKVPYLRPPAERRTRWLQRLSALPHPLVGICWSGNKDHNNDRARSIPFDLFAQLTDHPNASFVSLQHEVREADRAPLAARPSIVNLMHEVADMADTAAIIDALDLVICVDTSVAHLAGALAKPVWILVATSADWRWLKDRDTSPWYPTAKLFRQTDIGDWNAVLGRIRTELQTLYRT